MIEMQKAPWSDWETVRLIGRGSFGTVYEIQRKLVDEDTESAALKVITIPQNPGDIEELYSEGYDDESITATFNSHLKSIVAEYSLMRKMDGSANIVNCKDIRYIQHDDGIGWDIFIRMELLTPLMKALPADTAEQTIIKIGKDICNALVLCKKHEIIHRDIKPQNIFISPNGDYKLGDFGIAKTVEKTMGGTKIGTYKYMAPEVYNNQPYGSAADIYSLGLVLYWLLNERRMPFMPLPPAKLGAGMDEEARHRRLSGEPLPAPAHGSDELKRIVLKACAYDPQNRYASAAAMLEDLKKLGSKKDVVSPIIIPDDQNEEKQEDEKTMGPVFGGTKTDKADSASAENPDATIGPAFIERAKAKEDKKATPPPPTETPAKQKGKGKSVLKYVLITLGVIAAIVLLLMLKSCGGKANDDHSLEAMESHSSSATEDVTEPAVTEDKDVGSTATEEGGTGPVQLEWSGWLDELPEDVSSEAYEIEERVLYSSRTLETKSSTEKSTMEGWELFDTAEANGEFGPWSDWSDTQANASASREVDTQIRYRYSDKVTTTGNSQTMSGWEMYDTTYSWSDYGSWSDWIASPFYGSDSRKVESKTQYRYRDISYSTEYTDWGSWSGWQDSPVYADNLTQVETRTVYEYGYFYCPNCGFHWHGHGFTCFTWAGGCGKATIPESSWTPVWGTIPQSQMNWKDWHGTGHTYAEYNGERVFRNIYGDNSKQQYRYSTRSTYQEAHYGNWSNWSNSSYNSSSTREVETRTVYRYCDRSQIATYHFWKWGSWSEWSTNKVSASGNRQVESTTFYRYRDKVTVKTYYFKRWSDWSEYSTSAVTASDTVEVDTKTQYRYKSK